MNIHLFIFTLSIALYLIILTVFSIMIHKAKKNISDARKKEIKGGTKFYSVFIFSLILIILPALIYFEIFVTAVLCACALLGEYIVLKDMLDTIKQK